MPTALIEGPKEEVTTSQQHFISVPDHKTTRMAPNLAAYQHDLIPDMILSNSLTTAQMADVAHCSERSVRHIRSNLRCFGTTRAPFNGVGRPRSITPPMLRALCEHLIEKPELYQYEMAVFQWDEFEAQVTVYSIGRALASVGWSKKAARRIAKERNADLRDFYLHKLSFFQSYQLVYVDESGCDKRIGFRRTGWSPVGVTPVQTAQFHRDQRYQILPAYAQDGIEPGWRKWSRSGKRGDVQEDGGREEEEC